MYRSVLCTVLVPTHFSSFIHTQPKCVRARLSKGMFVGGQLLACCLTTWTGNKMRRWKQKKKKWKREMAKLNCHTRPSVKWRRRDRGKIGCWACVGRRDDNVLCLLFHCRVVQHPPMYIFSTIEMFCQSTLSSKTLARLIGCYVMTSFSFSFLFFSASYCFNFTSQ